MQSCLSFFFTCLNILSINNKALHAAGRQHLVNEKKVSPVLKQVKRVLEFPSAFSCLPPRPAPPPVRMLLNLVSNERGNGPLPTLCQKLKVTIFDVTW